MLAPIISAEARIEHRALAEQLWHGFQSSGASLPPTRRSINSLTNRVEISRLEASKPPTSERSFNSTRLIWLSSSAPTSDNASMICLVSQVSPFRFSDDSAHSMSRPSFTATRWVTFSEGKPSWNGAKISSIRSSAERPPHDAAPSRFMTILRPLAVKLAKRLSDRSSIFASFFARC